MFTRARWTRRDLGDKDLGKAYGQPEQVMKRMKNYATRPSALPFLTSIPEEIPWAVLQDSDAVHEVHPFAKSVPAEQIIRSLGTYLETFKGEAFTTKEDGAANDDDAGVHSGLWDRWVMDVYPLALTHKMKRSIEGLRVLCLRWWKRKVIHGMFKWLGDKYGGF